MAKTAEIKISADIEYRVISNAFGLLVASAGLLSGAMVRERSLEYWMSDIVPLVIVAWLLFRLFRNFLATMIAYHDTPTAAAQGQQRIREAVRAEKATVGQITARTGYTEEQVLEEVAKRIEAKKAEAMKTNKFTN